MKYINLFNTETEYDNAEKQYPNSSYIVDIDQMRYEEKDPTLMVAKWNLTSSQSILVVPNSSQSQFTSVKVDGEPVTLSGSGAITRFLSAGEHEAVYKLADDTKIENNGLAFSGSGENRPDIYLPATLKTFKGCFGNGSNIKDVYITDLDAFCKSDFSVNNNNTGIFSYNKDSKLFLNNALVTSLTIPNSVTTISANLFRYYSNLSGQVTIPNSVTSIGNYAFMNTGITGALAIPSSVTSIGTGAFQDCSGLTSISIPNSVTFIGDGAFSGCGALETIVVDSGNTKYSSLNGSNGLFEKNIANKYKLIRGCKNTVLPTDVANFTSIGRSAFSECRGLTSLIIPNSVTSIDVRAFLNCTDLSSITISNSVTSIGQYAFQDCSGLASITCFATTPPTIQSTTFQNVPATCPIYVPAASVDAYKAANGWSDRSAYIQAIPAPVSTTITATFTTSSPNMSVCIANKQQLFSEITVEGSQQTIGTNRMNYTFATAGDHVVTYTAVDTTAIGIDAFDDCRGLTSIIIPNSVTSIDEDAFNACYDLASVTLSDSLITIGENAFNGTAITSLTIPEGVTTIGDNAFHECEYLDNITLPSTLTSIGYSAFARCTAITSMTCYATTPPTAGEYALTDIASDSPVFVPAASVSAYQSASGWSRLYIEPIQ